MNCDTRNASFPNVGLMDTLKSIMNAQQHGCQKQGKKDLLYFVNCLIHLTLTSHKLFPPTPASSFYSESLHTLPNKGHLCSLKHAYIYTHMYTDHPLFSTNIKGLFMTNDSFGNNEYARGWVFAVFQFSHPTFLFFNGRKGSQGVQWPKEKTPILMNLLLLGSVTSLFQLYQW